MVKDSRKLMSCVNVPPFPSLPKGGVKMKVERLNIRISEEDKAKIQEDAKKLGLTISAYLIMLWKQATNKQEV